MSKCLLGRRSVLSCLLMLVSIFSGIVCAQFLPDNKSLNTQSVQRWMQSNRDMTAIVQIVDASHNTDEGMRAFEVLTPKEQDKIIVDLLKNNSLLDTATLVTQKHGWKSVGEYMRLSIKLGNAIAAYFLMTDLARMDETQAKALKEKADPAVLAVAEADVEFIRKSERTLRSYIQAYAASR